MKFACQNVFGDDLSCIILILLIINDLLLPGERGRTPTISFAFYGMFNRLEQNDEKMMKKSGYRQKS